MARGVDLIGFVMEVQLCGKRAERGPRVGFRSTLMQKLYMKEEQMKEKEKIAAERLAVMRGSASRLGSRGF